MRGVGCPCGCGMYNEPKWFTEVVEWLESIFGDGIYITSGNRCEKYNSLTKGASKTSRHIKGDAFDIAHVKTQPKIIFMALMLRFPYTKGIGYYPFNGFVHIDGRLIKKRWERDALYKYHYYSDRVMLDKILTDKDV